MTEQERRVEAVAIAAMEGISDEWPWHEGSIQWDTPQQFWEAAAEDFREGMREEAQRLLDAADCAVPMVSATIVDEMVWLRREQERAELTSRAERAEGALRTIANQIRTMNPEWRRCVDIATEALS